MVWRALLVLVLTVVVFLITGIFASSPSLLGGINGLWVALAVGVLMTGGLSVGIRHYRENKRLQKEVKKWKARVQSRIWRGY